MSKQRHPKKKPSQPVQKPKAAYDLNLVHAILQHQYPNPNVRWVFRKGGQSDYEKLGYTEPEALNIVRSLRPKDFDITLPPLPFQNSQCVDVYKTKRPDALGKLRTLYIKFHLRKAKK